MNEYISKQTVIRAFAEYEKRTTPSWSGAYKETLEEWIDELTEMLSDIPTIDIVYCRKCEYWDGSECQCEWASTDHEGGASYSLDRDADDFCSYGERKK